MVADFDQKEEGDVRREAVSEVIVAIVFPEKQPRLDLAAGPCALYFGDELLLHLIQDVKGRQDGPLHIELGHALKPGAGD
jgi:hypothetical protein